MAELQAKRDLFLIIEVHFQIKKDGVFPVTQEEQGAFSAQKNGTYRGKMNGSGGERGGN